MLCPIGSKFCRLLPNMDRRQSGRFGDDPKARWPPVAILDFEAKIKYVLYVFGSWYLFSLLYVMGEVKVHAKGHILENFDFSKKKFN